MNSLGLAVSIAIGASIEISVEHRNSTSKATEAIKAFRKLKLTEQTRAKSKLAGDNKTSNDVTIVNC